MVGVDIDTDKIAVGTRALAPLGERATVSVGVSGRVPEGPWDAIVILDVLYLLPSAEQHALIDRCVAALAPGGRLLVKGDGHGRRLEGAVEHRAGDLAVKVLRITEGHEFDFVPTATMAQWLRGLDLRVTTAPWTAATFTRMCSCAATG